MDYMIYVKMPSYLAQWLKHRHGGSSPISFIRGSIESKMLQRITVPLPKGELPKKKEEGEVAIIIPWSKCHDPRTYNHVTECGKRCLVQICKNNFDIELWEFLSDFGKIGHKQKELIYLFMEQHGIIEDGSCWDAIAKIYQRMRNVYLTKNRYKKSTNKTRNKNNF